MVNITIDGRRVRVQENMTIMEAAGSIYDLNILNQ